MQYIRHYGSPLGTIWLAADEEGLTGLWFEDQKHFPRTLPPDCKEEALSLFSDAKRWLDLYFTGREPDFSLPLHLSGTPFQQDVWNILLTIPYGQTTTYRHIARQLAAKRGISSMSAQAVGNAVGRNPVSIVVPCHRVVGSDGTLTGYAGGIQRKAALLTLEGQIKFRNPNTSP